jgi:hypothetical protein
MARNTESACAACSLSKDWETLQAEKQAAFQAESWTPSLGMEQMARNSEEKRLAWSAGHSRPFALLTSMRPALRAQVATCLGVPLLATPAFGDSHREAWALLSAPQGLPGQTESKSSGLLTSLTSSRGSATASGPRPTWYHVLRRVLDRTFGGAPKVVLPPAEILAAARDAGNATIVALEKEALSRIARFCLETGRIRAIDFGREDKEGLHLVLGHYLGAEGGGEDDRAVLNYAWRVVATSRGIKQEDNKESKKKMKPFPVPPDMAPLFNAVVILLNQRILLAGEGISPEQFYGDMTAD